MGFQQSVQTKSVQHFDTHDDIQEMNLYLI